MEGNREAIVIDVLLLDMLEDDEGACDHAGEGHESHGGHHSIKIEEDEVGSVFQICISDLCLVKVAELAESFGDEFVQYFDNSSNSSSKDSLVDGVLVVNKISKHEKYDSHNAMSFTGVFDIFTLQTGGGPEKIPDDRLLVPEERESIEIIDLSLFDVLVSILGIRTVRLDLGLKVWFRIDTKFEKLVEIRNLNFYW